MIARANFALQLCAHFGFDWLAYRLKYALQQRLGTMQKRLPATTWDDVPLSLHLVESDLARPTVYCEYREGQPAPFFFSSPQRKSFQPLLVKWDSYTHSPVALADEVSQGCWRYFEHTAIKTSFPPNWFKNPFTGEEAPREQHWSQIPDFGCGDIKVVWEPSRFAFVYSLVRAYWRTGNSRYAELFWLLVESWRNQNCPQMGPNWKCGQEVAFRTMAWSFGLYGFADAAASTPERIAHLVQMIAISGQRIATNLDYALSQRNNHGISEGVGLWTIGLLFPEFRSATKWRQVGQDVLERLARDLIYEDGAFSQNSLNYHRLMLHDYIWAIRLGQLHGSPLSDGLCDRIDRALWFLYELQDNESGQVPLYGPNDGALILPLNNCNALDFRPVLNAGNYLLRRQPLYKAGPWSEDLLWLFGKEAISTEPAVPKRRRDFAAGQSGYYTIRSADGFAFTRCGSYRDRPGHADSLHCDLWWRGHNIACDAGTYSYNAPDPWNYELSRTQYHNTVTVDGLDQMQKRGKFLWLPWLAAHQRLRCQSSSGHLVYWEGEHNGYHRLPIAVSHRRAIVRLPSEHWLVLDYLFSREPHTYRLHWLLKDYLGRWNDDVNGVTLETPSGRYYVRCGDFAGVSRCDHERASSDSPRGWCSPYYLTRQPALSVALEAVADKVCFWSLFGPAECAVTTDGSTFCIHHPNWSLLIHGLPRARMMNVEKLAKRIELSFQNGEKDEIVFETQV